MSRSRLPLILPLLPALIGCSQDSPEGDAFLGSDAGDDLAVAGDAIVGRIGLVAGDCDPRVNTCIVLEEVDADEEFNRRMIEFTSEDATPFTAWGECVGPPGFCSTPRLGTDINYLCSTRNTSTTDHASINWACEGGRYCGQTTDEALDTSLSGAQCRDPEFQCSEANRLQWGKQIPPLCSNAWTIYEIVAEVVNPTPTPFPSDSDPNLAKSYCSHSVRHGARAAQNAGDAQAGCGYYLAADSGAPDDRCNSRPVGDNCGPEGPVSFGCLPGSTAGMVGSTPACPGSATDWPEGLDSLNLEAFITRAEVMVGQRCAEIGCGSTAVCRPLGGGVDQIVDAIGGERVGPGIMLSQNGSPYKNDSFIGHARVCSDAGGEICNDPDRTASDGQCLPGWDDDSRDAVVVGPVSWAEIDISCHCAEPPP